MRLFIAIELSEQIRGTLAQIESHLKYAGADVKWVEKDNIHLTLKFLGEVPEEKIEKIKSILDDIGKTIKSFELSLKVSEEGSDPFRIGAFPSINNPRVIWVGLDKGAKESIELAGKIDEELSKIGFQKETRPFAAHLTIGRVRSSKNREALKQKVLFSNSQLPTPNAQLISAITLYHSKLTPKGPIYTKLYETKFLV